ncbi:AAA family ATPase [Photobacterium sp. TY1-4]|uniref:AAA family ATPase n=1 Tax=Photobacterium sp. TY1-4 TaxID=2899122 RepID=UPI0021BE39EE|nr:AAA family ATPase [Photobacterium sp. TY1-4]UXI04709.1 AAA family ATPase [Photobacterium sp. TY1-4]
MPNARQISEEQQDIFEDAPMDGSILVSGPPGTGKTVIAFLRAHLLAKKKQDVTVIMFNRVLRRYTENVAQAIDGSVQSKTMHSWFPGWWHAHRIPNPEVESTLLIEGYRAYVNCPYEQKDELKKLGGRFERRKHNPFTNRNSGMWYVPLERYNAEPEAYTQWANASYEPPEIVKFQYNWPEIQDMYFDLDEDEAIDWGHLIIDEAQDFEPGFYSFLHLAARQLDNGALTILADENQRLEENRHSSLEQIRESLKLSNKPDREFRLTKNFRNTKQIAKVARHFYVGLETGMPDLPDREGDKPALIIKRDTVQQVEYICNYLQHRRALEVGIILDSDEDREYFFELLTERLENYTIQTYSSKSPIGSEKLEFDRQGVVTVLHRKSCKGLEFDTVFVPQLQGFSVEDTDLATFKMNLYVICSRTRTELVFLCNGGENSNPSFFKYFPTRESGLIDYREQK